MRLDIPFDALDGPFVGKRQRFTAAGSALTEDLSFDKLPKCEVVALDGGSEEHHSVGSSLGVQGGEEDSYVRLFPGGIRVECPWIITADLQARTRVSWMPEANLNRKLLAAEIGVLAVADMAKMPDGSLRPIPPRLTDFFVDTLEGNSKCIRL
jgi:hypothetical protein